MAALDEAFPDTHPDNCITDTIFGNTKTCKDQHCITDTKSDDNCACCNQPRESHVSTWHYFAVKGECCTSCGTPVEHHHNIRHMFSNNTPERDEQAKKEAAELKQKLLEKDAYIATQCCHMIYPNMTSICVLKQPNNPNKGSYNYCYFCANNCVKIADYNERFTIGKTIDCDCSDCMWN